MSKKPIVKAKPMPARTLKALKASIEKWRKNETGDYQGIGIDSCQLCTLFMKFSGEISDERVNCEGCPVFRKTGKHGCNASPYESAGRAAWFYGINTRQFRAAAKKERIFLESLLPKEARS